MMISDEEIVDQAMKKGEWWGELVKGTRIPHEKTSFMQGFIFGAGWAQDSLNERFFPALVEFQSFVEEHFSVYGFEKGEYIKQEWERLFGPMRTLDQIQNEPRK